MSIFSGLSAIGGFLGGLGSLFGAGVGLYNLFNKDKPPRTAPITPTVRTPVAKVESISKPTPTTTTSAKRKKIQKFALKATGSLGLLGEANIGKRKVLV